MTKIEIHHACSFGSRCHSAHILKRNACKKTSYPFDWIMSNHKNNIQGIDDDFKLFLDKSQYIIITPTQCGHKYCDGQMFYPITIRYATKDNINITVGV
jgi:hypothetical protein